MKKKVKKIKTILERAKSVSDKGKVLWNVWLSNGECVILCASSRAKARDWIKMVKEGTLPKWHPLKDFRIT